MSPLRYVHVIDDFGANLLVGNDVLVPEGMSIDLKNRRLTLGHDGGVYAHVVDANLDKVLVRNTTSSPVTLGRRVQLGTVAEYNQTGCYLVMPDEAHKASGGWLKGRSWKRQIGATIATVASAYAARAAKAPTSPMTASIDRDAPRLSAMRTPPNFYAPSSPWSESTPSTEVPRIDPNLEHGLFNGVTAYGTTSVVNQLDALVRTYQADVFVDSGTTVDVPEDEWMPINLKPDAKPKPGRVYPLGSRDRDVLDKTFDELHRQGKLHWSTQPTSFSYPAFVVWRELPGGERKGRVVVDIRGLNEIAESDTYPLPLQSDIISAVAGYDYISTVDARAWFHQFNVKRSDRSKFTVISHRGQEESSVALMGYKGSPPYVQRQTDKLLRQHREYARAYVDDMIIFSRTLEEHLKHLATVFQLFRNKRVSLSPTKSYLGYPSVVLLGQRVDSLGMSTSAEKIAAITSLRFPYTLRDLEFFLGLTGWLRSSVSHYAQRALPLQERKTALTKDISSNGVVKDPSRKRVAVKARYEPTAEEREAFSDLQGAFAAPTFLTHYSKLRRLYIDASKQFGLAAMVYHVLGDPPDGTVSPRTAVQPIMFLSKCLNTAEKNYWPTELEVAGIVWVVRKIRHMIESTEVPPVIVYTDHSAAVQISRQTTLTTSCTDKLNLRLVRASQYLSSFSLSIRHKPGKSKRGSRCLIRI